MPIEPGSELGQSLQAELPIGVDATQLSTRAGQMLVRRMDAGASREDAVLSALNDQAAVDGKETVVLDSAKLFTAYPAIKDTVAILMLENGYTRGQAITRILLDGVRSKNPAPNTASETKSIIDGAIEAMSATVKGATDWITGKKEPAKK